MTPRSFSQRTWQLIQNVRAAAKGARRVNDPSTERARAIEALSKVDPAAPLPQLSREALAGLGLRPAEEGDSST